MQSHPPEILQQAALAAAQLSHPQSPFALADYRAADGSVLQRFAHAPSLLSDWLDAGRAHAQQPFLHYWDNSTDGQLPTAAQIWSYADFFALADTWAQWLRHELQLPTGVRLGILAANSPQWIAALAAGSYAGAVLAPLNSMNCARESLHTLAELAPSLLFCDAPRLQALLSACAQGELAEIWQPCPIVLLEFADAGSAAAKARSTSLQNACAAAGWQLWLPPAAAEQAQPLPPAGRTPDADALIVYTSGSAATPKGAVFTHDAVCQALQNLEYIGAFAAMTSPAALQKIIAAGHAPCLLSCVPYFHVSGLYAQVLSTLKNGRKLVLLPKWNPASALALIAREQVTAISAAPSMVMQLMAQDDFGQAETTGTLSAIGFGGSAMPLALQQATAAKMPDTLCGTGFGMTETGGAGAGASGALFMANMGSAGLVSPIVQVRIRHSQGQRMSTGEDGEICLRGPSLMHSYWQRPEETAQALQDGWMHTGDWGSVDADNYLYVSGRMKEVINRHGEKIAASEVEAALASHPAVREVAVLPLPDPVSLECVAACVVHAPGLDAAALLPELQEHARLLLPAYKVPSHWQLSTQALPRNAMHKVLKKDLVTAFSTSK